MDIKFWDSMKGKPADFLPSPSCEVASSASIKDQTAFWTRARRHLMFAHVAWTLDIICVIFIKGISRCYFKNTGKIQLSYLTCS